MFQSNLKFYLKSTINIADTTSDTFIVSEDFELGAVIDTGGETVSIVLRNARQIERFECTITAGVATIVKRGLTQVATATEDALLKKQWTEGTTGYITALAFDIIDKGGDTMIGALKFSGPTNQGLVVNSLTTTQRLALTPTNGAIVYDSTLGENYQYIAGAWSAMASGSTQPNASLTVAGKVEIATQVQVDAGTDAGETGAFTVVIPSTLKQTMISNGGITGEVKMWTTATAPTNWLVCDGSSLLRAGTYAALFAVIGTTYGTVDGTHFNIPDFRGRSPLGSGTGTATGATAHTLGATPTTGKGGEETHLLTGPESGIAAHSHTISVQSGVSGGAFPVAEGAANSTNTTSTAGPTNAANAHNIMSSHTVINFIIRI